MFEWISSFFNKETYSEQESKVALRKFAEYMRCINKIQEALEETNEVDPKRWEALFKVATSITPKELSIVESRISKNNPHFPNSSPVGLLVHLNELFNTGKDHEDEEEHTC